MKMHDTLEEGKAKDRSPGFYIRDTRSFVGNCVLWWHKSRCGYTTRLDEALVVDAAEAERIHRNRESDVPVPVDEARAASSMQVDVQRLDKLAERAGGGR